MLSTKMNASQRQEFCVRWNSHLGSIGAAFPQLLAGQRFVDVTLACEGHQVHCHRLVLAACSSYFESILAENPCKHPVIILPSEIKLWEIQALVDFMYKGEVNVTQAGLPQLLRCAEQLRIRGLYGSDAALNLNQLKALTGKVAVGGNGVNATGGGMPNDPLKIDETLTHSGTTTTAAATTTTGATSVLQQAHTSGGSGATVTHEQILCKKEPLQEFQQTANGADSHANNHMMQLAQNHHQHIQIHHPKQEIQINTTTSNAPTEDESADDSTSNAYDHFDDFGAGKTGAAHLDSAIEEDHNYVAHDEEDSYGGGVDQEQDSSANSSLLQTSLDTSASFKRVRRSEASLAQAAKCVSKGQTFQTVSNMFNIPVSTIRFYMARKGILPKRKRGRGASSSSVGAATSISSTVMAQALAQMKRSSSPSLDAPYHLMGYKINEQQGAANMI